MKHLLSPIFIFLLNFIMFADGIHWLKIRTADIHYASCDHCTISANIISPEVKSIPFLSEKKQKKTISRVLALLGCFLELGIEVNRNHFVDLIWVGLQLASNSSSENWI